MKKLLILLSLLVITSNSQTILKLVGSKIYPTNKFWTFSLREGLGGGFTLGYNNPASPDSGAMRYLATEVQYYNGSSWQTLGTGGAATSFTKQQIDTVSTIVSGIWNASVITTPYGGTGLSSWTQGDIPYYNSGTALSKLAKNTSATRYLSNTGTNNNPAWAEVDLSNGVTGLLPLGSVGGLQDSLNDRYRRLDTGIVLASKNTTQVISGTKYFTAAQYFTNTINSITSGLGTQFTLNETGTGQLNQRWKRDGGRVVQWDNYIPEGADSLIWYKDGANQVVFDNTGVTIAGSLSFGGNLAMGSNAITSVGNITSSGVLTLESAGLSTQQIIRETGAGQVALQLDRDGANAATWNMYLDAANTHLSFYGGGATPQATLSTAGLLTVPAIDLTTRLDSADQNIWTAIKNQANVFDGKLNTFDDSVRINGHLTINKIGDYWSKCALAVDGLSNQIDLFGLHTYGGRWAIDVDSNANLGINAAAFENYRPQLKLTGHSGNLGGITIGSEFSDADDQAFGDFVVQNDSSTGGRKKTFYNTRLNRRRNRW